LVHLEFLQVEVHGGCVVLCCLRRRTLAGGLNFDAFLGARVARQTLSSLFKGRVEKSG
jgi:hypothetical protein